MHSMTEATSTQSHDESTINGYMDAYPGNKNLSKTDIAIVMFGMLFPLVTQIGHAHAHAH
jgi:zinc transporter 9